MSCEICGRSSCSRIFHSIESQQDFDKIADDVKDRMRNYLINKIKRLNTISNYGDIDDNADYVKLNEVIELIDNY